MRLTRVALIATAPEQDVLARIEDTYRTRIGDFCRVARAVLGDDDLARDAVQDGFVRAIRDRGRFRGDAPLEAWVWGCVMHSIQDAGRSLRKHRAGPLDSAPLDLVEHSRLDDAVRIAVRQLPERQRHVLFLRHYADLDYREIGVALGITTGTVSATLHAAHTALREALKKGSHG
jgi:RNA polymerase sigma-70 factor, ECF subfamily